MGGGWAGVVFQVSMHVYPICLPLFPGIADRRKVRLLRPLKLSVASYLQTLRKLGLLGQGP